MYHAFLVKIKDFYFKGNSEEMMFKICLTPIILTLVLTMSMMGFAAIATIAGDIIKGVKNWTIEISNGGKVMVSKEEYYHLKENNALYLNYIKGTIENSCQE